MKNLINELRKAGYKIRAHSKGCAVRCAGNIIELNGNDTVLVNKREIARKDIVSHLQTLTVEIKVV